MKSDILHCFTWPCEDKNFSHMYKVSFHLTEVLTLVNGRTGMVLRNRSGSIVSEISEGRKNIRISNRSEIPIYAKR